MNINERTILLAVFSSLLQGCDNTGQPGTEAQITEAGGTPIEISAAAFGTWGVELSARDETVKPGDDFFRYANGTWLDNNEIPAERTSYGMGLIVHERAQQRVRDIIEELRKMQSPTGTPEQKVGDFYASWMDTETVNELGITPLQPDIDRIMAIDGLAGLTIEFGQQYYINAIIKQCH